MAKSQRNELGLLGDYVKECYAWSKDYMEGQHDKFIERYSHFRQIFPKNFGTRSQLYIPKSTALVLNMLPRLIGDDPQIRVIARGETPQDNAMSQQNAIMYETAKMDYFMRLYFQMQSSLIYGIGVRKNIWWTQIETIRRRLSFGEMGDLRMLGIDPPSFVMDTQVVYDGPWSEDIDIFDYYPDPDNADPQGMNFVCFTDSLTELDMRELAELKFLKGVDYYFDKIRNSTRSTPPGPNRPAEQAKRERDTIAGLNTDRRMSGNAPKYLQKHPIVDFWGKVPFALVPAQIRDEITSMAEFSGVRFRPKHVKLNVIITEDGTVLRAAPFPYFHNELPISVATPTPLKGEHVGLGIIELMQGLQEYELYRRNNLIDNINRSGNGMWKKMRGSRVRDFDLISRAGGIIRVDRMDELQPLENPMAGKFEVLYRELALGEQEWQEASGFSVFSQGRDAPGVNKTASGVAMIISEANNRLNMARLLIQKMALKADGMQFIGLNKQFIQNPVQLSLIGRDEPFEVSPDRLWGDFDVDAAISPNEPFSMAVKRENFMLLTNIIRSSPLAATGQYNLQPLDEKAFKMFGEESLIDEVMTPNQKSMMAAMQAGMLRTPGQVQGAQQVMQSGPLGEMASRMLTGGRQ